MKERLDVFLFSSILEEILKLFLLYLMEKKKKRIILNKK